MCFVLQLMGDIAEGGATGVIIEWEDMFPYTGEFEVLRSANAYSQVEVISSRPSSSVKLNVYR